MPVAAVAQDSRTIDQTFMATWQFDLLLVHVEHGPDIPPDAAAIVTDLLTLHLGPRESMLADWTYFGTKAGNRFDVVMGPNGECELSARLDARSSETDRFIQVICEAATCARCRFFCHELNEHLEPDAKAIRRAIQRSTAWRFAINPASALR